MTLCHSLGILGPSRVPFKIKIVVIRTVKSLYLCSAIDVCKHPWWW